MKFTPEQLAALEVLIDTAEKSGPTLRQVERSNNPKLLARWDELAGAVNVVRELIREHNE